MTEAQWLASGDPEWMLNTMQRRTASFERACRLFACACCRLVWDELRTPKIRGAIETAERFALGEDVDLAAAISVVWRGSGTRPYGLTQLLRDTVFDPEDIRTGGRDAALQRARGARKQALNRLYSRECGPQPPGEQLNEAGRAVVARIDATLAEILRCITPNPFRLTVADPAWLTPAVGSLARQIDTKRTFDRLPALAKALQAAGCADDAMLGHCRSSGPHATGCWVVDLCLGREQVGTGTQWPTCTAPEPMLAAVRSVATERKLRLFACACARRVERLMTDLAGPAALDVAERFADGQADTAELTRAHDAAWSAFSRLSRADGTAVAAARYAASDTANGFVFACEYARQAVSPPGVPLAQLASPQAAAEGAAQADLLRCVCGNPFHSAAFSPAWRTSTAVALAQQMYESRDFSAMPILADALQDAGCDNDDVLNHCREPGPHVRGCWVVDLVLGKS